MMITILMIDTEIYDYGADTFRDFIDNNDENDTIIML